MSEDMPQDPLDEVCRVTQEDGNALPSLLSRANAEQYAALLNETHPQGLSHVVECKPVGVVDAIKAPPIAPRDINSFAPSAGTRGI